jgi:hypothetical protein
VTGGTAGTSTGGASSGGASSGGDGGRSAPGDAGSSTGGVDSGGESVPGPLTGFTSGVRAASNEAVAVYPNACAAAVPPLRVLSPADVTLAITEYVGGVLGVPLADLDVHPNACGGPASATCANIFGHDLGGLGGPLAQKILPLAERIDQEATEVVMLIVVPTRNGLVLPVVRVLAGIRDGWLMAIAAFANADTCGAEPG